MSYFVWTKMQAEGGQPLATIISLKEAERAAGNGVFWWGFGTSLGKAVYQLATQAGGTLPILFSRMITSAQKKDANPEMAFLWTEWEDCKGQIRAIPSHVLEWSREAPGKEEHYALVCHSDTPLINGDHGTFDPRQCRTRHGKRPGDSMVTVLLEGDLEHSQGAYHEGFRANLVPPWQVKLVKPQLVSPKTIRAWTKKGGDWQIFVNSIRGQ